MSDVIIIGGGIVGAAAAYHLSLEGMRVHLIEKGAPVSGASSRGEGNILFSDKPPGPELELQKFSTQLWAQFAESDLELDIELEPRLALTPILGRAEIRDTTLRGTAPDRRGRNSLCHPQ